jgi:hypothetical protein
MAFSQFDPKKTTVIVGTAAMRAFADGEMINVEFTVDKRSKHIGTDGEGRHIKSADASGVATIRLARVTQCSTQSTWLMSPCRSR